MKAIVSQNKAVENKIEKNPKAKNGYVDKEGVYHLSDFQLEKLRIADEQIANGEYIDQDEMDKLFEQWLKEK
jgi:hypothetical protein